MSRALREMAYHEAGHAVAHIALRQAFLSVSIEFNDDSAGRVETVPPTEKQREYCELASSPAAVRWWDHRIIVCIAGNMAQALDEAFPQGQRILVPRRARGLTPRRERGIHPAPVRQHWVIVQCTGS